MAMFLDDLLVFVTTIGKEYSLPNSRLSIGWPTNLTVTPNGQAMAVVENTKNIKTKHLQNLIVLPEQVRDSILDSSRDSNGIMTQSAGME